MGIVVREGYRNINDQAKPMNNPVILALDVDSQERALSLVDDLADIVGGFKIGPRLCLRYGNDLIKKISDKAPVFMDNKHFDIPSTMISAIRASFEAGASLVSVHALAGKEALIELGQLEHELNQIRPFKILCVTILTSWVQKSYPSIIKPDPVGVNVKSLAYLAIESGLRGVVCSPHELELFDGINCYLVTPGIRFPKDSKSDQKRVMGPKEAIKSGASAIVVGRPIIEATNPKVAAAEYLMAVYDKK